MSNRVKEEEKNEKIIRGLLKHPANKRCINCNSLGPQYVCTNFQTFICTNCSGLHREFTHRVKSISMAKFTSQEVSALQEGGNERAREVYFKDWDPQRHSFPESSHFDRLRDFIKHVYVERRYAGGKKSDDPSKVKGERADCGENRRSNTDRSGSRSPPYNDPYERRFNERPGSTGRSDDKNSRFNYEARSPGYDQGDYKSPSRFEMRDEISRDNKDENDVQSPRPYNNRVSDELPKSGVSDHKKGIYISSPPMVRPVREILGGDIPPLQVGELTKFNRGKAQNSASETQDSTSSKCHNDETSLELKRVNSGSLIDFSVDSEPLPAVVVHETFLQQTDSTPRDSGWASFDISKQKAPEAASTAGDLESVFAQLSVHASTAANSAISSSASTNSFLVESNGRQWSAVQQQPSLFPVSNQSTHPRVHAPVQIAGPSFPSAVHGSMPVIDGQSTRPVMHLPHRPTASGNTQNPLEAKANGRKELPMDLFTGLYSASPVSYPAWPMGPHHGMVYRVQYPVMMPVTYGAAQQSTAFGTVQHPTTTFHNPPISTNPFDLGNELAPGLNPTINPPSASLQAAVQNPSNPLSLPNRTKLDPVTSQWMSPQQFSYPSSASSGPYMMQQFPYAMPRQPSSNLFPSMNQGGVGNEATPYGVLNGSQLSARTNSSPVSNNSLSSPSIGGNPFR